MNLFKNPAIGVLLIFLLSNELSAQDNNIPAKSYEWKTAASAPRGAEEVIGVSTKDKFYMFGGLGLNWEPLGMVMEYDPKTDTWTRKNDMPVKLHHMAFTYVEGKIYMFGGFSMPKEGKAMWVPVTDSWMYDPEKEIWKILAPLPSERGSANAVHINGKVHLIGGASFPEGFSKNQWIHPSRLIALGTHEVYDIATNTWTNATDMPTPRNHAAAGMINNKIYVAGGRAGSVFISYSQNLDLVEEYDPSTDRWDLKSPMPTPRSATAWDVYEGHLYVAGGEIRHKDIWGTYTTVEAFDPKNNTWIRLAPMPMPRHGLAGGFIENKFHLVSGSVQSGTNEPGLVTNTDRHDVLHVITK